VRSGLHGLDLYGTSIRRRDAANIVVPLALRRSLGPLADMALAVLVDCINRRLETVLKG
jgi:hypothetical protein